MNLVVLVTAPNTDCARMLAQTLVTERLAACVSLVPGVLSVYCWEGEVEEAGEVLLIIKTRGQAYSDLEARIQELHPYSLPEIIALPIEQGSKAYQDWLEAQI